MNTATTMHLDYTQIREMLARAKTVDDMRAFAAACRAAKTADECGAVHGFDPNGEADAIGPWELPLDATVLRDNGREIVGRLASGVVVRWDAARGWRTGR